MPQRAHRGIHQVFQNEQRALRREARRLRNIVIGDPQHPSCQPRRGIRRQRGRRLRPIRRVAQAIQERRQQGLMAKVVFRIRYYLLEDADLEITDDKSRRKVANRNYYSSNQSDGQDYLNYIEDEIKQSGDFDYIDYVGVHERSIGAFDEKGILDATGKKELREALRNTKSVIWDCVISPEEELSKKKLQTYEDAKWIIEKCLPRGRHQCLPT